ncbi:hypothetical protein ACMFMG_004413 [Clarireedia jacksonii]
MVFTISNHGHSPSVELFMSIPDDPVSNHGHSPSVELFMSATMVPDDLDSLYSERDRFTYNRVTQ